MNYNMFKIKDNNKYEIDLKITDNILNIFIFGKPKKTDFIYKILNKYFEDKTSLKYNLEKLDFKFTRFQFDVYKNLLDVPFGKTVSYKELAEKSGNIKCYRAIGSAMRINPFPILIPCHRVIKLDMTIGGYSCGIEIKKLLLNFEKMVNPQ